jgi:hypothetical protein
LTVYGIICYTLAIQSHPIMVCTSRQKAVEAAGQYRIQKYDKEISYESCRPSEEGCCFHSFLRPMKQINKTEERN